MSGLVCDLSSPKLTQGFFNRPFTGLRLIVVPPEILLFFLLFSLTKRFDLKKRRKKKKILVLSLFFRYKFFFISWYLPKNKLFEKTKPVLHVYQEDHLKDPTIILSILISLIGHPLAVCHRLKWPNPAYYLASPLFLFVFFSSGVRPDPTFNHPTVPGYPRDWSWELNLFSFDRVHCFLYFISTKKSISYMRAWGFRSTRCILIRRSYVEGWDELRVW